jgi:hypothetical protein
MTRLASLDRANRVGLLAFLFVLLVVVAYTDPVLLRRSFAGRDLLAYNLPMEFSVHDAYARGRLPVWSAEISGGRPLAPNPNVGAFYPVRMLLALVPFPVAMRIFPVWHWAFAGIGMLLLLRSMGASGAAAWVSAVAFSFSGVAVSEVYFPHIHPGLAFLPWITWALRGSLPRPWRMLCLALLFGLDLLAADLFTITAALLCALLWIGLEIEPIHRKSAAKDLAGALLLAGLLAAPQIVATSLWIPETNRAVLGIKLGDALLYTISPFRLLEFLVPYPFGPTWSLDYASVWAKSLYRGRSIGLFASLYCGAFALVAVARMWRERRFGVRFARALFTVGILLAVVPSLVPSSWYSLHAPIALRNPEKFAVLLVFALSIFSGLAFDRFRSERLRGIWSLGVGGALAVVALVCRLNPEWIGRLAVWTVGSDPAFDGLAAAALPGALAEAGIYWMGTVFAIRLVGIAKPGVSVAGALVLTAVMLAANCRIAQTYREDEVFAPTAFARAIQRRDPLGSYRALGESLYLPPSELWRSVAGGDIAVLNLERRSWMEHTHALWKYGTVLNYDFDAGDLSRVESLRRLSRLNSGQLADLYRCLSLRWGIRFRDQPPLPGYRRMGGDAIQDWDEQPGADTDIRLLERWAEENDVRKIPGAIAGSSSGEVVLETEAEKPGRARPGQVAIVERSPERLEMRTACPDPTWLFVLRGFWTYRSVLVDGRPAEIVPAQIAFSAVALPAGNHRIEWVERLPGEEISRWGPVLFVLIGIVLVVRRESR